MDKTNWFIKLINFFAGSVQDHNNNTSSKRIVMYFAMYLAYILATESVELSKLDKKLDPAVFMFVAIILLFSIGAVTSEFISKYYNKEK